MSRSDAYLSTASTPVGSCMEEAESQLENVEA